MNIENKKIINMYVECKFNITEISKILKINRKTVSKILKDSGIEIEKNRKIQKQETKEYKIEYRYFCRLKHEMVDPSGFCDKCGEVVYYIKKKRNFEDD